MTQSPQPIETDANLSPAEPPTSTSKELPLTELEPQRRLPMPTGRSYPEAIGQRTGKSVPTDLSIAGLILAAIAVMLVGMGLNLLWLWLPAAVAALVFALPVIWLALRPLLQDLISAQQWNLTVGIVGGLLAAWGVFRGLGGDRWIAALWTAANWDAVGALGEVFGALGQILIAVLAVYVAWRQYVIEKELTTQQNLITQQQTIDSYFQGISELVVDEEGLLEDWPQERAIAEARTAAILSSVDAGGKAKILRFLSRANLLSPLKRDQRLGRAILDGAGGYAEDRAAGIRVIDLGVMLAGANLAKTDLRWTDLSEINLIRANLTRCDLVRANLARTILVDANLEGADLKGTRLFYGKVETASPRSPVEPPNYQTGEHTGVVIEGADLTNVVNLSPEQRYYCCAWGGSKTRATIPGGCEGIPNQLGR
jgi:uncharacterized protein YjbI with pentapeptide repeats